MATRKSSSRKASPRRDATGGASSGSRKRKTSTNTDKALPGISAAERKRMAQQEAKWQAESDLRILREAEQIRRDRTRLQRAATIAAEEMRALQAVRSIRQPKS